MCVNVGTSTRRPFRWFATDVSHTRGRIMNYKVVSALSVALLFIAVTVLLRNNSVHHARTLHPVPAQNGKLSTWRCCYTVLCRGAGTGGHGQRLLPPTLGALEQCSSIFCRNRHNSLTYLHIYCTHWNKMPFFSPAGVRLQDFGPKISKKNSGDYTPSPGPSDLLLHAWKP